MEFDQLFGTKTGYAALDQRIAKTRCKKTTLLTVLDHPEIPLHNNPAELDERVMARRRDVSLHCRDEAGADEMDTFTSIVQTARKLLVNGYEYLYDRLSGALRFPSLSSRIQQRSEASPTPSPRAPPSLAASSLLGGVAAAGV
ncbi:MAG: transposase [Planctomycetota bacterium]|nr:transposase [Planctomycetota bacterium]